MAAVASALVFPAYGEELFRCAGDGAHHIGVRAKTRGWNKENLLNFGVQRTPEAGIQALAGATAEEWKLEG